MQSMPSLPDYSVKFFLLVTCPRQCESNLFIINARAEKIQFGFFCKVAFSNE